MLYMLLLLPLTQEPPTAATAESARIPWLVHQVREYPALQQCLVDRDVCQDAPQVAPIARQYACISDVGFYLPCAAEVQQYIQTL
jgi:hypothetical protein